MKLQVGGDFARAGRSHNLVGWAVSPRGYLQDFCFPYRESLNISSIEISPVAARPINPKRPTLMKASFQRADLFVFTDFVGDLFSIFRCTIL